MLRCSRSDKTSKNDTIEVLQNLPFHSGDDWSFRFVPVSTVGAGTRTTNGFFDFLFTTFLVPLAIDNNFLIIREKRSLISFNSIFLQRLLNLKFRTPLFLGPLPFEPIPPRLKELNFHIPSRKWMSSFACSLHSSSCFLVVVGGYFLTKWSDGGVTETEGYLIGHKIRPAGIETQVKEDDNLTILVFRSLLTWALAALLVL